MIFDNGASIYQVGQHIPELALGRDGCQLTFNCGCPIISVLINRPTPQMIADADTRVHGLRLGLYTYHDVMMLAAKPGQLPWHDAPFSPHLSAPEDLPQFTVCPEGCGFFTTFLLIDSSDGSILDVHAFTLSERFSNKMLSDIQSLSKQPLVPNEYLRQISAIQQRYTSRQLGESVKQVYFHLPPS